MAGGVGLSPLKNLIENLLGSRRNYGRLILLYGAASPEELLFKDKLSAWNWVESRDKGVEVMLTVDKGNSDWGGNVGLVTELVEKAELNPGMTSAVICGPSAMMKHATEALIGKGFDASQLYLSFERKMQCGMGMCGHCTIGHYRVCREGPVFTYAQVRDVAERLW